MRSKAALAALAACLVGVAWFGAARLGERRASWEGSKVRVVLDGRAILARDAAALRRSSREQLEQWLRAVPSHRRVTRGRARIALRTDAAALADRVQAAVRRGGGDVPVPERPVSSTIRVPLVQQALPNNCETAALSMILAAEGKRQDQLSLQRELPPSGPLDPASDAKGRMLWGDPDRGFVGRADGGGAAGGFGVYPGPVRALSARHGVRLDDVGGSPARVYARLLEGHPVMAWVGLSDGPYRRWVTSDGRTVDANFGEHAVVLTGFQGRSLEVNNPLSGDRERWSRGDFEHMWDRLGRRALGT